MNLKDLKNYQVEESVSESKPLNISDIGNDYEMETPIAEEAQGYAETLARHGVQGATFGLSDELRGLANSPSGAGKQFLNAFLADDNQYQGEDVDQYTESRDAEREALRASQEANTKTAIIGQILGGLLPGGAIAKGVGMLAGAPLTSVQTAVRAGGLEGALYGAGQSDAESASGVAKEAAIGAGLGGVIGGAAGQLGKFLGGNADDVARGAIPESEGQIGAWQKFKESGFGKNVGESFDRGVKNINTTSPEAQAARQLENDELSTKLLDKVLQSKEDLGTEIGERYKALDMVKPESLDSTIKKLEEIATTDRLEESRNEALLLLKNIKTKLNNEGVDGSDLAKTRNYFQEYRSRDSQVEDLAKKLGMEFKAIASEQAGELSPEFSELASLIKSFKLDKNKFNQVEKANLAAKLKSIVEKSQTSNSDSAYLNKKLLGMLSENLDDPEMVDIVSKIKENAKYNQVYQGITDPNSKSISGFTNRAILDFVPEVIGSASQNPLVKTTGAAAKGLSSYATGKYALGAPAEVLNQAARGLEAIGATKAAAMTSKLAATTDEGKKRAILNMMNQMPTVKKAINDMISKDNDENE